MKPEPQQPNPSTMLSLARDLPNICSLLGLFSAVVAIHYAILGNFPAAIIGLIWTIFFDWSDGIIARRMKGRTDQHRAFGGQLDSIIDIVSFGVFPAIFLLSYGKFSPWFLPGAFLIVAVSVIRLSYFNIFGLNDDRTYVGLALDNNVIVLAFVFLFEGFFTHTIFSIILYALLMVFLVANLANVRTPTFAGKWFYVLIVYTLILTVIYSWMQLNKVQQN